MLSLSLTINFYCDLFLLFSSFCLPLIRPHNLSMSQGPQNHLMTPKVVQLSMHTLPYLWLNSLWSRCMEQALPSSFLFGHFSPCTNLKPRSKDIGIEHLSPSLGDFLIVIWAICKPWFRWVQLTPHSIPLKCCTPRMCGYYVHRTTMGRLKVSQPKI